LPSPWDAGGEDGGVRKTSLYVAAWFAAGVGAVALATGAVSLVGSQVTGDRPGPLSADQVRSELAGAEAVTTTTIVGASPTAPLGTATSEPGAGTATTAVGGVDGPDPAPSVTTTTPPGPGPAPTTTAPPGPTETRTYSLVGGTATLQFSPSGVQVLVASPNAGYSVDVGSTHDTGVRVEFSSDDHRSRVEGWWEDGPRDEVEETN
jgi:hypothetical protein